MCASGNLTHRAEVRTNGADDVPLVVRVASILRIRVRRRIARRLHGAVKPHL